jgi:ABC-type transport system substrate-binding protein
MKLESIRKEREEKMKRLGLFISLIMIASLLAACATPTPEIVEKVVEKEVTREVEKVVEKVVTQVVTQVVEVEREVTKIVAGTPVVETVVETQVVEKEVVVTATPEPVDTSKFGGTLVLRTAGMIQFDFAQCADDASWYVISNVYSTIYRIAPDRSIYPDMATSWEYEDDTTLILHLRQGVMWQDGNDVFPEGGSREVLADDVVYSIEYGVNKEGSTLSAGFLGAFESVEAVDDYTVKLKLSKPDALLMSGARGLGHIAVIPHEAVEHYGEDFGLNPIGSGPFEFAEYKPDEYVRLVPNEDYWKTPYLDEVIFRVIPDDDAALIAFETGEVDYMPGVPEAEIERLKDDTRFVLTPSGYECAPWIMFNMAVPLFQDQEFRQAMAYAIDAEAISRNIEKSNYVGGCGISGRGVPGYDPNLCKYFPYDPEGAAALLAELGWADTDGDGVLDKDGEPMAFELEIWNMGTMPRYGEAIAIQLKEAGFGVELQTVEFGTWIDDMLGGTEKAFGASGFCTDGGLNGVFGREAATSVSLGWDMPTVHDQLDEANVTVDAAERDKILREAQEALFSQYLAIPMRHRTAYEAVNSRVRGFGGMDWTADVVTERYNAWVTE